MKIDCHSVELILDNGLRVTVNSNGTGHVYIEKSGAKIRRFDLVKFYEKGTMKDAQQHPDEDHS